MISSANFAPMSGVKAVFLRADSVAYAASIPKGTNYVAPVPKGTSKVPNHEAGTEALCSSNCLRRKAKNKAPFRAKGEVNTTSLPKSSSTKFAQLRLAKLILLMR